MKTVVADALFKPLHDRTVFPDFFSLPLRQSWLHWQDTFYSLLGRDISPMDDTPWRDIFLLQMVITATAASPPLPFLWSDELAQYLNAPCPYPTARPLSRFLCALSIQEKWVAHEKEFQDPAKMLEIYQRAALDAFVRHNLPDELLSDDLLRALAAENAQVSKHIEPGTDAALQLRAVLGSLRKLPPPILFSASDIKKFAEGNEGKDRNPKAALATLVGGAGLRLGVGAALRHMALGFSAVAEPVDILSGAAFTTGDTGRDAVFGEMVASVRTPVVIFHFNTDILANNFLQVGGQNWQHCYRIAYVFWEAASLSEAHRIALPLLHEIWAPNEFMAAQYRGLGLPVYNMGYGLPDLANLQRDRKKFNLDDNEFIFFFNFDCGSRLTRKNPLGIIQAFQRAFMQQEKVRLILKTHNTHEARLQDAKPNSVRKREQMLFAELLQLAALDSRIQIMDVSLSSADNLELMRCADAYVSLHRAEGLGLGMAEAMQLGIPVIATGWSGNAEFVLPEVAFPIKFELRPIERLDFHYANEGLLWAEPDIEDAAAKMRFVYEQPLAAQQMGRQGQQHITKLMDLKNMGQRMQKRLLEIVGTGHS